MGGVIRKPTIEIELPGLRIGGGNPIVIQSMTNTDTRDADATIGQIERLTEAGCELVRVAVPDTEAADAIARIKRGIRLPLAADIHFDYRLALRAMEAGADKLRINPGNIGDSRTRDGRERLRKVVDMARERGIPIRIGVNSGSLERDILEKHSGVTADGLVESALRSVKALEDLDFGMLVVSIKSSSVPMSVAAYEALADKLRYPLHVGITEAGISPVKSAAGIGAILSRGIGDTIRVSLTGDPADEVRCAREILKALELRTFGPVIISCPTCGRTQIDLVALARAVERYCAHINKDIKIAVMGCAVNGPGEAREADIGVAGGQGCGLLFKKGEILRKVPEAELVSELIKEIELLAKDK